eukprot:XP_008185475.1 PREDICTED: uncharacterized protein LOC100574180 [Acyrthosiphon pisum]
MEYYQDFLDRQNQHLKNRIIEDKNKNQAINYNPDWDANHMKADVETTVLRNVNHLSSGVSVVTEQTSNPRTKACCPITTSTTSGHSSRQSVHSTNCNDDDDDGDASMMCRPGSRQSVRTHRLDPTLVQRLRYHIQRPGTGCEGVLFNTDGAANRHNSRLSVGSNTSRGQTRPQSRSSQQSHKQMTNRPLSRKSVRSTEFEDPYPGLGPCPVTRFIRLDQSQEIHNKISVV